MPREGKSEESIQRVLIYRLGSLGDTVVALPSFHLVARAFPNAERRLLTNFPVQTKAPPAAAILEGTGLVHGYFRFTVGARKLGQVISLWWQLWRWRPEVLVFLAGRRLPEAKRDRTFFRLCGIRRMIGVPLTAEMKIERLERTAAGEQGVALEYEAKRLAENLAELGDARLDEAASWELSLSAAERAAAADALRPAAGRKMIAVSTGTKVQVNDWGRDNWRALLKRLAARYGDHALVVTGSQEDKENGESIAAGWREGIGDRPAVVLNLCGALSPRESACVFQAAEVFIGHNSGPMHLAAAMQTRCVAIFSAREKPKVWFPYGRGHRVLYHQVECWGCNLATCLVEKKRCITSIGVDEVLTEVRAVLD